MFHIIRNALRAYLTSEKVIHIAPWGDDNGGFGLGSVLNPYKTPQAAIKDLKSNGITIENNYHMRFMGPGRFDGDITIPTIKLMIEGDNVWINGKIVWKPTNTEKGTSVQAPSLKFVSRALAANRDTTSEMGLRIGDGTNSFYLQHTLSDLPLGAGVHIAMRGVALNGDAKHDDYTGVVNLFTTGVIQEVGNLDMTAATWVEAMQCSFLKLVVKSHQRISQVLFNNRVRIHNAPSSGDRPRFNFTSCQFNPSGNDMTFYCPANTAVFDGETNYSFQRATWKLNPTAQQTVPAIDSTAYVF